ncbi:MAG: hypothetical protein CSB44_06940 [Gammaproteobacteria bacterium]|nr:MAG: hypothetical protein CSB44_06940 [Gammaproteobacteria bacterium]
MPGFPNGERFSVSLDGKELYLAAVKDSGDLLDTDEAGVRIQAIPADVLSDREDGYPGYAVWELETDHQQGDYAWMDAGGDFLPGSYLKYDEEIMPAGLDHDPDTDKQPERYQWYVEEIGNGRCQFRNVAAGEGLRLGVEENGNGGYRVAMVAANADDPGQAWQFSMPLGTPSESHPFFGCFGTSSETDQAE